MLRHFLTILLLLTPAAHGRIYRIVVDRVESPTFSGQSFGKSGAYEKIIGRAFGELDPTHPLNRIITDLHLAPRDSKQRVQYETTFYLLKPINPKLGNGLLFYSAPNRGDKRGLPALNRGVTNPNDPTSPGDALAQERGYSILWSAWQADVPPGNNRLTLRVPSARNPDGTAVTGPVRIELQPTSAQPTWSYSIAPPVTTQLQSATLTAREQEADPRLPIPRSQWAFGDCSTRPFPGEPSLTSLCIQGGFRTNLIYEFIYTAQDPPVLGIGMAATRDLVAFLRYATNDDMGTPNPLANSIRASIAEGQSQAGRFLRTFLDLGFNQSEDRRLIFDGMNPHIASQGIPVNVRFGQPDRAMGQRENALYPAAEGPLTWSPIFDPIANREISNLDTCRRTQSCPKIIQTTSATEFWQGRMSLNITNAEATLDLPLPSNVRLYHFASTQHTPTASSSRANCQAIQNPAPFFELRRAALISLEQWVLNSTEPPPSQYPRISDGTLVPLEQAAKRWPQISGAPFPKHFASLTLRDFGPGFDAAHVSGITTVEPPRTGKPYRLLVPQIDADGNELAGLRSPTLQAPQGTYTGWALRREGFGEGELCGLAGQFIPFAPTREAREASKDPRPSLAERYPTPSAQQEAAAAAAQRLLEQRYLLPQDAKRP